MNMINLTENLNVFIPVRFCMIRIMRLCGLQISIMC